MGGYWFTVIGYIVFVLYTCGIMLFGVLLEKKTNIDATTCRKITHVISSFLWTISYYFFGFSAHWVILNVIGAVVLGFATLNKGFSAFRREDCEKSYGMFYFGLSTAVVAVVCYLVGSELYLYTGIAYYCLALGDGIAPLVAKLAGKYNVNIRPHKTLVGSASVFIISFIAAAVFSHIFGMGLEPLFLLSVAALTTVVEFYGFKGTDNIFIELFVFGYLVLYHYGLVSDTLQVVLLISPALAILAVGLGAMTAPAGAVAFVLFALVGLFGPNFVATVFIGLLFLISTAVAVIARHIGKKRGEKKEKSPRRARQIVAVGLFAIVALTVHSFTGASIFYYIFFLALTEQLADSMSSDIGRFTKGKNLNIVTWRPVEKGISGGVSLLGTVLALVTSFLFMVLPLALGAVTFTGFWVISLIAFLGTVIDSVVGAIFQSLYLCKECDTHVESHFHCGKQTQLVKGFKVIDNVAVNYIAGILTCGLGALLLLI